MSECLVSSKAAVFVLVEAAHDEIFCLFADFLESGVVESVFSLLNSSDDSAGVLAWKRHLAREQNVEHDSHGPYVAFTVIRFVEDLWGDVEELSGKVRHLQSR